MAKAGARRVRRATSARRTSRAAAGAAVLLGTLALVGCTSDDGHDVPGSEGRRDPAEAAEPSLAVAIAWERRELPAPSGWRAAPRNAVACGDGVLLTGSEVDTQGDTQGGTRPAGWMWAGTGWQRLDFGGGDLHARSALVYSAACRRGVVAAVGAASGGAHGNPRTSTWYERDDGVLINVRADFELFGGWRAVSVGGMAAGPDGYLIAGSRTSGAAVWRSVDGRRFVLLEGAPGLAARGSERTAGRDAIGSADGWTVVGTIGQPGDLGSPAAWVSRDGRFWTRQPVPSAEGYGSLERVVTVGPDVVGAGLDGEAFRTWRRRGGTWRAQEAIAPVAEDATQAPYVTGLAADRGWLAVSVADGRGYQVWVDAGGGWSRLRLPTDIEEVPADGDTTVSVGAAAGRLVLVTDDGKAGAAWIGPWPARH